MATRIRGASPPKRAKNTNLDWPGTVYVSIRARDNDEELAEDTEFYYFYSNKLEEFNDGEDVVKFDSCGTVRQVSLKVVATFK